MLPAMTESESAIELRLLGPIEAVRDGDEIRLGGPRQRALLGLLAIQPARVVPTDRLIDELWAGDPPDGAETTLRSYVSRLRGALREGAQIRASSAGYSLQLDPQRLDVRRFESLIHEAESESKRRKTGRAADHLREALALWRGRPFGSLADDGVLRVEADRLSELRLHALELRIEADLSLGESSGLVDELEGMVAEHPYREAFWRQLMLALYRADRQADALAVYHRARAALDEQLGLEPGEELERLQIAILRHEVPSATPPEERHNLPVPLTSFIGRTAELAAVEGLLKDHRLVTLTGVGGVGKTRLALEAARPPVAEFPDGVWFVDLASIGEATLVPGLVAAALDIREQAEANSVEPLGRRLRDRDLLLLLDNCEHLREPVAELAAALLEAALDLRILATSRAPLGVPGEIDYPVQPLGLPLDATDVGAVRSSEAVALFLNRAATVRPTLASDEASLLNAARICLALDGLPLAMELAAARARVLSLQDIASRLHDRFRFLVSWRRLAAARHRTLREAMDWSHDLLSDDERDLLARLSVFAGGFTLDAVTNVCFGGDEATAIDLVERLVDASLVVAREQSGRMRYALLETVRQYAAERLEATGKADTTRRAHARHYLQLVKSANLSLQDAGRGPQKPRLVEPEEANVRVTLDWALDHDIELGLRLAVALENFWVTRDPSEADRCLGALLARADSVESVLRARATRDHGSMAHVLGDFDEADARYVRSRELFEAAGDARGVAELTYRLGIIARKRGNFARARQDARDSLAGFRRLGDRVGEVEVLTHLALLEFEEGNLQHGFDVIGRALAMTRDIGWTWWEIQALGIAARWLLETGRVDEGERHAREALALAVEPGYRTDQVRGLVLLAWAAAERGDRHRAGVLWAAAEAETAAVPTASWGAGWATIAPSLRDTSEPATPLALADAVRYALSDSH
jgi:predicted ATPase/DNA-binding SARP family transcriptional activator